MKPARSWIAGLCAVALAAGAAGAAGATLQGYAARVEALALIQTLNADLLSHDSATETLQRWCDAHGLARGARITAHRLEGIERPADAAVRADLAVAPTEPVRYRHVQLMCGARVLSEAENWYLPSRLTPSRSG